MIKRRPSNKRKRLDDNTRKNLGLPSGPEGRVVESPAQAPANGLHSPGAAIAAPAKEHWRQILKRAPISSASLVTANLFPLAGALFWGWGIFPIVFLFWLENVIIGVFNVLRMACVSGGGPIGGVEKVFMIPFFIFHYGVFTFVHGIFVIALFGRKETAEALGYGPFAGISALIRENVTPGFQMAVIALVASHAVSFILNYIGQGEFRRTRLDDLMIRPYGRVVVLHVVVLAGGLLITATGQPLWGLVLFVALKTGLDLRQHWAERRRFAALRPA